jgi:TPR repeat protein
MAIMALSFFRRLISRAETVAAGTLPANTPPSDAEMLCRQGLKFANGDGVARDYKQAVDCYQKAANENHIEAQYQLGLLYWQGRGVPRNEAIALQWLRRAAEQGHAGAQYQVGLRRHRAGKSCPEPEASECRVEAFKWLQLAVVQGHHEARTSREFLALDMTREEVAEGGRRAGAFTGVAHTPMDER